MALTEDKYVVPMLTDKQSFDIWRRRMKSQLVVKGLDEHIEAELPDGATPAKRTADKKAAAMIKQCLDDKFLRLIDDDASAHQVWTKLEECFKAGDTARWLDLRGELSSLLMKSEESVTDYVSRGIEISTALSNIDKPVSEEELVGQLLHGLPDRYDVWRTIMKRYKVEDLTVQKFFTLMMEAEATFLRQGKYVDPSLTGTALAATSRMGRHRGAVRDRCKCYYCEEEGHMAKDCPLKAADEEAAERLAAKKMAKGSGEAHAHMASGAGRHKREKPFRTYWTTAY